MHVPPVLACNSPYQTKGTHAHGLQIRVPDAGVSPKCSFGDPRRACFCCRPYLLVISKVVPKIWARTNSAMVKVFGGCIQSAVGECGGDYCGVRRARVRKCSGGRGLQVWCPLDSGAWRRCVVRVAGPDKLVFTTTRYTTCVEARGQA